MFNVASQRVALYVLEKGVQETDAIIADCVRRFLSSDGTESITVVRSKRGAPLIREEGMPFVSVSHSGRYTVCAVSEGGVGVDSADPVEAYKFYRKAMKLGCRKAVGKVKTLEKLLKDLA